MPGFDKLLRHDGRAREGHVDEEGPSSLGQFEAHRVLVQHVHAVDGLDLRPIGIPGALGAKAVEGELDVVGRKLVSLWL